MAERVVVVGGGQAGVALVAKLRAEGFGGAITLIGEEPLPPYQRPPLSKRYLLGQMSRERLLLRPASFYEENVIELRTATPARAIDRAARAVVLADDTRLPYDVLVLATGARPRRLPAAIGGALAGVHLMRTLADADALAPELEPGRRVLVVGGGWIGLEAAAVCASRGLSVTVVELAPRILARVACAETAAAVRALHEAHGVEIREGTALERLEGDERVEAAVLAGGERLAADLVIVGIGVTPETSLAEAAGLAIDNGVAVDSCCRTSDPAILAVGDCASFPWRGRRIRLESVQNAVDQGEHAARVILGATEPYDPVPWFWSDQYDTRLQIAGLGEGHDRIIRRPGQREGSLSHWYFRGDTLLAVDALGDPRAFMQGRRWLEAGVSPDPERLADARTDLRGLT